MKKSFSFLLCALAISLITGCSSISVTNKLNDLELTEQGKTIAHVNGHISGFYIFGFVPIWCGSPSEVGQPVFFLNKVKLSDTVNMVTAKCKSKDIGATKLIDLQSTMSTNPVIPFLPAFLMSIKKCEVSGNCIK